MNELLRNAIVGPSKLPTALPGGLGGGVCAEADPVEDNISRTSEIILKGMIELRNALSQLSDRVSGPMPLVGGNQIEEVPQTIMAHHHAIMAELATVWDLYSRLERYL